MTLVPKDPEKRREQLEKHYEWERRSRRNSSLRRRSHLNREARMKESNPARRRRRFKHHYGSKERAEFFANQPCDSCGKEPTEEHPSHNHHVRTGGMGTKAHHRWIIPLCSDCHRAMHGKDPPMGPQTAQAQAELWAGRWAKHTEDG